jgi:hypothetical protein
MLLILIVRMVTPPSHLMEWFYSLLAAHLLSRPLANKTFVSNWANLVKQIPKLKERKEGTLLKTDTYLL